MIHSSPASCVGGMSLQLIRDVSLCAICVHIDPLHSLLTLACLSVEREPMEYAVILFCSGEACEIIIYKKVECCKNGEAFLLFYILDL